MRPLAMALLFGVGATIVATPANAADDPPPPLQRATRPFNIDIYQGPVLGGTRVIGLAGAYGGIAEGALGIAFTPAAVVHRALASQTVVDWDINFDFLLPGVFQGSSFDFNNTGRSTADGFYSVLVGGYAQRGPVGFGYHVIGQGFSLGDYSVRQWIHQLAVGFAAFEHQLLIGAALRMGSITLADSTVPLAGDFAVLRAFAWEVGVLVRPHGFPYQLGVVFISPSAPSAGLNSRCTGAECPPGVVMPAGVVMPWQARVSLAYRVGFKATAEPPAYLRGAPSPKTAKREQPPPAGRYLLFSLEVAFIGAVERAITASGFAAQLEELSGVKPTVTLRFGAESEVWPRRMRLRAGSYWEPGRARAQLGRVHGTFSLDVRLFDFRIFGFRSLFVGAGVDIAQRYSNLTTSIGLWK